MVDVLGATGSLLPVLLSSNARADKPPVAPTGAKNNAVSTVASRGRCRRRRGDRNGAVKICCESELESVLDVEQVGILAGAGGSDEVVSPEV